MTRASFVIACQGLEQEITSVYTVAWTSCYLLSDAVSSGDAGKRRGARPSWDLKEFNHPLVNLYSLH